MCFRVEDEDVLNKIGTSNPFEDEELVCVQGHEGSIEAWGAEIFCKFDY